MLDIDFRNRITAVGALAHPLFMESPPPPPPPPIVEIYAGKSEPRMRAYTLFGELIMKRKRVDWYTPEVIFHSCDIFDRMLVRAVEHADIRAFVSGLDKMSTYFVCYVILYICSKFFCTFPDTVLTWKDFSPKVYQSSGWCGRLADLEILLVHRVCDGVIFRPTLLEGSRGDFGTVCKLFKAVRDSPSLFPGREVVRIPLSELRRKTI